MEVAVIRETYIYICDIELLAHLLRTVGAGRCVARLYTITGKVLRNRRSQAFGAPQLENVWRSLK